MPKKILIIQTSLNKNSKTALSYEKTLEITKNKNIKAEILDLRNFNFQMCNWEKIEEYNSNMNKIMKILKSYDFYILWYPVYNYSFSWVCKNFIDIFSSTMKWKKCWLIHNNDSIRSFSDWYSEIAKTLWLHDNVENLLPLVHTENSDFKNNKLTWEKALEKIENLLGKF